MIDLFSSLLHRHKGTRDVVKPRIRSRFETETINFAMPVHQLGTDESGEQNKDSQSPAAQIHESHSPDMKDKQRNPLQIETQQNRPVDQPLPPDPGVDILYHKPLIQAVPDISPVEIMNDQKTAPLTDKPAHGKHGKAPAESAPVDQVTTGESFITPMSDPDHRLDGHFDSRINAMLDRIEILRSAIPAPQKDVYTSQDAPSASVARAGDARDESEHQPRQLAPMDAGAERAHGHNMKDAAHPDTALDRREPSKDTQLTPPSWFSEMTARSMLPKNRPDGGPPAEPVVNVTIGRIEVKATKMQETSRVRQPQKPSGVMSLEKYLRRSERGGRR